MLSLLHDQRLQSTIAMQPPSTSPLPSPRSSGVTQPSSDASALTANGSQSPDLETEGLCLLSLDGGGVRGLSSLYILRGLMLRLNDERKKVHLPQVKPCDIFDLIGGTSTGGLIAIMLGRLEMDVQECIDAYTELMSTVFEKKRGRFAIGWKGDVKARFSSKALAGAIKNVIEKRGLSADTPFYVEVENEETRRCKVFVCAKAKETLHVAYLRAYRLPGRPAEKATILEAALATSAAPTFFDAVKIGQRMYVDGAMGANNPVFEVEKEAANIWCERTGHIEPLIKCFISVGTGVPRINPLSDRAWKFMTENIVKVVNETTETEQSFASRWRGHLDKRYFRFNVQQGLQGLGLAEYKEQGRIDAVTDEYLQHQNTIPLVYKCVMNLRSKKYPPTLEFLVEQAQALEEQDEKTHHGSDEMTPAETAEVFDQANKLLNKPREAITQADLENAFKGFCRVLDAKRQQTTLAPTPKELARIYHKMMSTCLQLSHSAKLKPVQKTAHVRDAGNFGKLALQSAIESGNGDRVAQMQFYLAYIEARDVQLRMEGQGAPDQALLAKKQSASEAVSMAWATLSSIPNLDMTVYDAMAQEMTT
ncbi:hypothetical protein PV10_07605 [Exophiala mesophila]|uniref:PNPLA domain-containing protein n=1 Tax=Exophiala mesophila TaxID=212818 RepID=A0A0D1XQ96_EXOME|nr:uncharacterized protein PV10_07605 [Exophiala mesophila]KIV90286.1 hypothetical protein PV10_07605 [Exophiala mesophila]